MAKYLKQRKEINEKSQTDLRETVGSILEDIKINGDEAVMKYSLQFDHWSPEKYKLSEDEIHKAIKLVPETLKEDIKFVSKQIKYFAEKQLESFSELEVETHPGIHLGHKLVPINSVGTYVPGGRAPLMSSAMMSTIPAKVAGVENIISFTPPAKDGKGIPPAMIFSLYNAGSTNIYSIGGVQAIASMAYGTETIDSVDMIVGPGNAFVAEAKRQVSGIVGIDLPAGPSEVLVIADESSDPGIVAADLLGQAEHDPNARSILISTSQKLAEEVLKLIPDQLELLASYDVASQSWENNGEVVVVGDYEEAATLSDEYAIEHLEVQTSENEWFLNRLKNYGSLFVGEEATVVYSDLVVGTNHILPTMTASRFTNGLWVGKFIKTQSYQRFTKEASIFIAPIASRLALAENMPAHSETALKRLEKYKRDK